VYVGGEGTFPNSLFFLPVFQVRLRAVYYKPVNYMQKSIIYYKKTENAVFTLDMLISILQMFSNILFWSLKYFYIHTYKKESIFSVSLLLATHVSTKKTKKNLKIVN
jgi:hypothetical protein